MIYVKIKNGFNNRLVLALVVIVMGCCPKINPKYGILGKQLKTSKYDDLHVDLYKNYVLLYDEMFETEYYSFFKLNEKTHKQHKEAYYKAVKMFYMSDIDIIDYLMEFRFNHRPYYSIVRRTHPLVPALDEPENKTEMTMKRASLLLIDNYLTNEQQDKFVVSGYFNKLTYLDFLTFYFYKEEGLTKEELKERYREYINSLFNN